MSHRKLQRRKSAGEKQKMIAKSNAKFQDEQAQRKLAGMLQPVAVSVRQPSKSYPFSSGRQDGRGAKFFMYIINGFEVMQQQSSLVMQRDAAYADVHFEQGV